MQSLETDRLASVWQKLRTAESAPPDGPAEKLAWHRRQIELLGYHVPTNLFKGPGLGSLKNLSAWIWSNSPIDLMERTDAFAAVWHLNRLLAHERVPGAIAARGYAHFTVGDWDKSVADFTEAWAAGVPHLSGSRGEAEAERGRFAEARADFLKALAEQSGDATPINDPRGLLMKLAYAQSAFGDQAGLHETLAKVRLHLAKLKPRTREAAVLLWTLALDPARDPEFLSIVKAFEDEWLPQKGHQSFERASSLTAVGLARFRLSDYPAALVALTEAETFGVPDRRQVGWLLLAMTCQKLNRTKEARAWLDKANQHPPSAALHWIDRLLRQGLRRQAEDQLK